MRTISIVLLLLSFTFLNAKEEEDKKSKALRKDAINVYMEGASSYMKKEVPFINYVRDIKDADLVVIGTFQKTGSGGGEYTFFVNGRNKFASVADTVMFNTYADETDQQILDKGVRVLKMGIMKYMINSPLAEFIDIRFTEPIAEEVSTDKWDNWVFTTNLQGHIEGQESGNRSRLNSLFEASRVTNQWKIRSGMYYNTAKTIFKTANYTDIRKESRLYGDAVKSLGEHWAAGLSTDLFRSIYSNYDMGFQIGPAFEYNIFPYSQSTRRIFTIHYRLNYGFNNYSDTTQFIKTEESLWSHQLQSSFTSIQQWGTAHFTAGWSNYLHDFSLNRFTVGGMLSVKIAKGLSVNLHAGYQFIHDQISLRKGNASVEDILLNRKELSTTFSYSSSIGITYRFGSIYNNVVNPRLEVLF